MQPNRSSKWWERYRAYIRSPEWQEKRQMMFKKLGRECMWCGATKKLQIHHIHYHTVGHEEPEDLEILCSACHEDADIKRAREGEKRAADALYAARLEGWASKKYGEEWERCQEVDDEFSEWLEGKEIEDS